MARKRIPKVGDRVSATEQKGTYVVYEVDASIRAAELQEMGSDLRISSVPWESLTFLDEEDASQAAARIVREATEDH
jgi:hypothetical protein